MHFDGESAERGLVELDAAPPCADPRCRCGCHQSSLRPAPYGPPIPSTSPCPELEQGPSEIRAFSPDRSATESPFTASSGVARVALLAREEIVDLATHPPTSCAR